jgi:hypothetical protein
VVHAGDHGDPDLAHDDAPRNRPDAALKPIDWLTLYFSSTSGFNLDWWGWIYHSGSNGTWVNAISSSSGDITG